MQRPNRTKIILETIQKLSKSEDLFQDVLNLQYQDSVHLIAQWNKKESSEYTHTYI